MMAENKILKVVDVMKREFDVMDGNMTVSQALLSMKFPDTRTIIVARRDEEDEHGIVLISDIAKKVLGPDRSPERVNLYEIMSKPVLGVPPEMNIRYCARLLDRFGIMRAPVITNREIIGIVSYHDLVLRGLMQSINRNQPGS